MGYRLGIDVGTTYTAAAVRFGDRVEMLALGNRALQVPSVVFVKADGEVLIGETAEQRGVSEPGRLVREFKRRVGDPVPILVAGTPYSPQALLARVLAWVVGVATERQGAAPEQVTVTHPANWGPFKIDLLSQAVRLADLPDAGMCTEPEAAAVQYASRNRLQAGETIAVYDLGGGTFDVAVLRMGSGDRFVVVGSPEGVEHLGGVDFDEAVFQHVLASVGLAGADVGDPEVVHGLARLRRDCVEAKEVLSVDTEAVIPVAVPGFNTLVRLNRREFEAMVLPALTETVAALRRALRSAGVEPGDLSAIALVGGSSRIPLVSEQLVAAFGRPLALDTHPKHDVARGAALVTEPGLGYVTPPIAAPVPVPVPGDAPGDDTIVLGPPPVPRAGWRALVADPRHLGASAAGAVAGVVGLFVILHNLPSQDSNVGMAQQGPALVTAGPTATASLETSAIASPTIEITLDPAPSETAPPPTGAAKAPQRLTLVPP